MRRSVWDTRARMQGTPVSLIWFAILLASSCGPANVSRMNFWWALMGVCALGIGITKSGFGSGMGLMLIPLFTIAIGHTDRGTDASLGFLAQLLVFGDLIAVYQWRRQLTGAIVKRLVP